MSSPHFDRRDFLRLGGLAAGGLILGIGLPAAKAWSVDAPFQPSAFLRIDKTGSISLWVHRSEMGQGIRTGMAMLVAEELDVGLDQIQLVQAEAHPDKYGSQRTVGSLSIRRGWMPPRQAGAAAREMLVTAAAKRWGVAEDDCATGGGVVTNQRTGQTATYGDLATDAALLPVPAEPTTKDPSDFKLVGNPTPQMDTPDRVTGRAIFGMDVRIPRMVFATVIHPPMFGGKIQHFRASRAKAFPGVREVFEISTGIVVVADNTWSAMKGAKLLDIEWAPGPFSMNSLQISESFRALASKPGLVAASEGSIEEGLRESEKRLEATYEVPYLAHATMEPMNCTALVTSTRCEIWVPTQNPQGSQSVASELTGLPLEKVKVHTTLLGCGLGRRASTDFVQEAVETAMKLESPVQVVWTREEDMQHDFYRPATFNRFEGGLDSEGRLHALKLRIVAPPLRPSRAPGNIRPDGSSVDGASNMPYSIPHKYVDCCASDIPVPVGFWRSVGPSQNTFILESFIDELAHAAGRDPLEFRLEMLGESPRVKHALEVAASKAGWGTQIAPGRARGIGVVATKGGYVAEIAEVSIEKGKPRVHTITCAVDCGLIVNPSSVEAQTVGCVVEGLTAALYGEITLEGGRVQQGNFDDYPLLSIAEMPTVDVHLIESNHPPGGAGEPPLPPVGPAVTNALFALTGKRIRRLPISGQNLA